MSGYILNREGIEKQENKKKCCKQEILVLYSMKLIELS